MKKLLLGALLLLSMISFSQSPPNPPTETPILDRFVGYWEPDQHSSQVVFWYDMDDRFQMIEFSTISGIPIRLLSLNLDSQSIIAKTIFDETEWETTSTYTLIDDNTMQCIVSGHGDVTIIYTKIK
mgnify:CR=1 FL=1